MKKFLTCRVTLLLLVSFGVLSVIGYIGKDSIYQNYQQDVRKTPYLALVFEGLHDGIYPWNMGKETLPEQTADISVPEENGEENTEQTEQIEPTEISEPREFVSVDESYFDDAVFIGDSRTVGLHDYGGLENATFYATVGMNVYDLWTDKFCEVDGEKLTLEEALTKRQYGKVYFQIGINEMGRGTIDSFMQAYEDSVHKLEELQPDAIIYVQGIMRVTQKKSESDAVFNNTGILLRNDRIAQLADNVHIFYIDMNEAVCDNHGNLKEDLTFDNVHLYASKYNIWVDFLKTKGVEPENP